MKSFTLQLSFEFAERLYFHFNSAYVLRPFTFEASKPPKSYVTKLTITNLSTDLRKGPSNVLYFSCVLDIKSNVLC